MSSAAAMCSAVLAAVIIQKTKESTQNTGSYYSQDIRQRIPYG
jgi:hypothetical protein